MTCLDDVYLWYALRVERDLTRRTKPSFGAAFVCPRAGYTSSMNLPSRRLVPYMILCIGIVAALYIAQQAASTAKDLQQRRFEDQQALNARLKQVARTQLVINKSVEAIDVRQDALGCTLESLQRRHSALFAGAKGPAEVTACRLQREAGPSNTEPSLQ